MLNKREELIIYIVEKNKMILVKSREIYLIIFVEI